MRGKDAVIFRDSAGSALGIREYKSFSGEERYSKRLVDANRVHIFVEKDLKTAKSDSRWRTNGRFCEGKLYLSNEIFIVSQFCRTRDQFF